jgi:hypothetical protein
MSLHDDRLASLKHFFGDRESSHFGDGAVSDKADPRGNLVIN